LGLLYVGVLYVYWEYVCMSHFVLTLRSSLLERHSFLGVIRCLFARWTKQSL